MSSNADEREPVRRAAVRLEQQGDIALVSIDHPPVNALNFAVRAALLEAVSAAEQDPKTRAIVISGLGQHFVAGAEIREFAKAPREPLLNDVLLRIEACVKPVLAALHGSVLGGGLELALACHYRLAANNASLGFPEIRLGLIPGSGGTQRLPRLTGAREAIKLMLSGEPIAVGRAVELGIVDRVASTADPVADATSWARELIILGEGVRRLRDLSVPGGQPEASFIAEQRAGAARKFPGVDSVDAIIECIQASISGPFDAGLALSRRRFEECRRSDASRALRHLFFAERGERPAVRGRSVECVGVLGAGTMGSGIAISLATAGYRVLLVDTQAAALSSGLVRVHSTLDAAVLKGRISRVVADAAIARVQGCETLDRLRDADLVIEAVYESLAVKQEVFASLSRICRSDAILASNTSTLDMDAIAAASTRAADVVGMHFFSPANVMRLIEIVRGRETAQEVIATVTDVSRRMGKLGVVVGNCFGFVGNRMLYAYGRENQLLMLEGATPAQVDAVLELFGMAMGPNAVGDLAGLDVGYRVRRERKDLPDDPRYYRVADLLVEKGRLGQKTGSGAYLYPDGSRHRVADPDVDALIVAEAERLHIARRSITDAEIRDRCLFALINEGASILSDGIAESPDDIDVIWCNGYGFPRYRGGPMCYADTIGPATVLAGIRRFAQVHGPRYWQPAPLLIELAERGLSFESWQQRRVSNRE
jgi:3-hydroxyacyl-CoA dehydrogenase